MLLITAQCRIKSEYWEDFTRQVEEIIPIVRKEPGCIRYELLSDVYTPGLFVFHEEWESEDHLNAHIATPHMQDHFTRTNDWKDGSTELVLYTVTDVVKKTL